MAVVAGGQAGEGHLLVARVPARCNALLNQPLRAAGTHRPVGVARLAEAAAPDAAPKHLQHHPVVDDLRGGHDGLDREIALVKVLDNALGHHRRRPVSRRDGRHRAVLTIGHIVEGGHIDAGNPGRGGEKLLLAPALLPGPPVELDDLHAHVLPLAQDKQIHKGGQRLWIEGAGTARHHDGGELGPLLAAQGQAGQIQHVEHIGVGHLIAQGKTDEIEVGDGVSALQAVEGDPLPAHLLLHIAPGGEHPLAPHPLHLIHQPVENPHAQIGHADLIGIRKTECVAHIHGAAVLDHRVVLPAGISGGLLYPREDVFQSTIHAEPSPTISKSIENAVNCIILFLFPCCNPLSGRKSGNLFHLRKTEKARRTDTGGPVQPDWRR